MAVRTACAALLAAAVSLALLFGPGDAATLVGTVTTKPSGRPTAGVWVRVRRVAPVLTMQDARPLTTSSFLALSDVRGRFRADGLPIGIYEITVCRDSLSSALAPESSGRAVLVSVNDRAETSVTLTRLATIEGRVWKQGQAPARSGRVRAFRRGESTAFASCAIDDEGRFRITGAEPGVEMQLVAHTADGVWQRTRVRPLRPGPWPFDFTVPALAGLARRPVRVSVMLPFAQDRPLELVWTSEPPEQDTGYESVVALNGEGRCEFLSPTGIFRAEVREITGTRRVWKAPRLYRVDADAREPLQALVPLEPGASQR